MKKADLIIKNGFIYTVDKKRSIAEAVAVEGNKIVYVGDIKGMEPFIGDNTEVIDLDGKMLLPGFVEAHTHPFMATCWLSGIIIDMQSSYDEILDTIRNYIQDNPDKEAYFGIGYDENTIKLNGGTRKEVLDEICKDKPILIQGSGGHEGWANTKSLEMTGVDKNTPDPIPGFSYYRRDEEGNPAGGLVEMGAISEVTNAIKPFNISAVTNVLTDIFHQFNSLGITTVADCGIVEFLCGHIYPIIDGLLNRRQMTFRTVGCHFVGDEAEVEAAIEKLKELRKKYDDDIFRVNTLKIINDGTVESRSASFFENYADGGNCDPLMEGEKLYNLCIEAAKEGFDINIHGIGDKAIHENLMAAKAVREAGYHDVRFTNSHTQYVRKDERELFGKYHVIANTSGAWHVEYAPNHAALGEERTNDIFTMKSIINGGGIVTLGSDFPVDEVGNEPLKGLEMSVTRRAFGDKDFPALQPEEEALTVEEAIAAYTINGAYQIHMEDKIGSIEVGKYADFVVLEKNLFEVEKHCIFEVPVVMTIMNGKTVYKLGENKYKADLIFVNGFVFTVDEEQTRAEAVAIKDGKINYVGSNSGAEAFIGNDTQIIDLGGKMILPSFFEAHGHASAMVELLSAVNLSEGNSLNGYIEAVKEFFNENPDFECITGHGWSNTAFHPSGPVKEDLDVISKDIPIALWSEDHHSLWVNSKALEIAKVSKDTPNPTGGYIERNESGEATGTLREGAADFVMDAIPCFSVEQYKEAIRVYQKMANSLGFTGAFDPILPEGSNVIKAYKELCENDELTMYFRGAYAFHPGMNVEQIKSFKNSRLQDNAGELFQINAIKLFKDGVIEGATAYLHEPYADGAERPEGYRGEPIWHVDEMSQIIAEAEKNDFQIHVHSIGDAATKETIDSFELAGAKADRRHAITHLQLIDDIDFGRFKKLGIVGVPNPYWFVKDLYYYNLQVPYLGLERAEKEYPFHSFIKEGVVMASASDFPVTVPPNPLIGIQIGITRTAADELAELENYDPQDPKFKEPLWPEERANLERMIKSFTYNGAYANLLENVTGSIAVGKSADLIVLDRNIFNIPEAEILRSKVILTLFQGKEVYRDE